MLEYKIAFSLGIIIFMILVDLYSWQGFKILFHHKGNVFRKKLMYVHYSLTVLIAILFLCTFFITALQTSLHFRTYVSAFLIIFYLAKFIQCFFLLIDDTQRGIRWIILKLSPIKKSTEPQTKNTISRAKFIATTGVIAGGIPLVALTKGIFKGAYDYQIHRVPLYLKNLPLSFQGLKVAQLSDIHYSIKILYTKAYKCF
jgi:hypothetical protein